MWELIKSAPKSGYILIREEGMLPDFVHWQDRTPERVIAGTKYLPRPAGWFTRSGLRSPVIAPTHWTRIPE